MYVFIHSPVKVGTLLMKVPGINSASFFLEFELKPTGNDSAVITQHEYLFRLNFDGSSCSFLPNHNISAI